jgi:hypothetical protein
MTGRRKLVLKNSEFRKKLFLTDRLAQYRLEIQKWRIYQLAIIIRVKDFRMNKLQHLTVISVVNDNKDRE